MPKEWIYFLPINYNIDAYYVGASSHDVDLVAQLADTGLCDYLMCRGNMAHRRAEQAAFPAALQRGFPVIAFTTTRWNTLQGGKGRRLCTR